MTIITIKRVTIYSHDLHSSIWLRFWASGFRLIIDNRVIGYRYPIIGQKQLHLLRPLSEQQHYCLLRRHTLFSEPTSLDSLLLPHRQYGYLHYHCYRGHYYLYYNDHGSFIVNKCRRNHTEHHNNLWVQSGVGGSNSTIEFLPRTSSIHFFTWVFWNSELLDSWIELPARYLSGSFLPTPFCSWWLELTKIVCSPPSNSDLYRVTLIGNCNQKLALLGKKVNRRDTNRGEGK